MCLYVWMCPIFVRMRYCMISIARAIMILQLETIMVTTMKPIILIYMYIHIKTESWHLQLHNLWLVSAFPWISSHGGFRDSGSLETLTHLTLVPHICVRELGQHWLRQWLVACSAPSHCLNQCWLIVNWTPGNKFPNLIILLHDAKLLSGL